MPLTETQLARIRSLHAVLGELLGISLKEWIAEFAVDLFPESRIIQWEGVLETYNAEVFMARATSLQEKQSLLKRIAGMETLRAVGEARGKRSAKRGGKL